MRPWVRKRFVASTVGGVQAVARFDGMRLIEDDRHERITVSLCRLGPSWPEVAILASRTPTSDLVRCVAQPPGQAVTVRAIDQETGVIRRIAPNDRGHVHQPHTRGMAELARQRLRIDQA